MKALVIVRAESAIVPGTWSSATTVDPTILDIRSVQYDDKEESYEEIENKEEFLTEVFAIGR
jgi:multisubunit Na+/H+ antiporter MnhE subunit